MSTTPIFRVHPAIGFARVGNSEEYYLAPETMAGLPVPGESKTTGGLPIVAGTEAQTITSSDLRDKNGAFKRQAARFRIFQYAPESAAVYPATAASEVVVGSQVNGKTVTDIVWTVHVANKKANCYVLEDPNAPATESVIDTYKDGQFPPLRNPQVGPDINNTARVRKLTIDPGPRAIHGVSAKPVAFDKATIASYADAHGAIKHSEAYPKSFPDDSFSHLYAPTGPIDTLGDLRTDEKGRLLVLGGYGRAVAWSHDGVSYPLNQDVDNDGWFDDTSDGPVSALLVFDDGSTATTHGAWVVATDPGYAPQTLNVVSLWDSIYDVWVRELNLAPDIYRRQFNNAYRPGFDDQLLPIFRAAALQQWNTNLPQPAIDAHQAIGRISAADDPANTIMAGLAYIRNPNNPGEYRIGAPLMPLSLGDSGKPFLSLTPTQYFFLSQWNAKQYDPGSAQPLSAGELLDKASLINCLGGRFSPGIDMTFIVRQPGMYILNWKENGAGPFRIKPKPLHYAQAQASQPFLSAGWFPLHSAPTGLEPGDTSKFMALPWHTDYNSCATHPTSPNPLNSTTLYWSWPAQRPVAVYLADDVVDGRLGAQRYSVRGKGTASDNPANQGRYQERIDMIMNWPRIGVVMQGSAIDGRSYSAEQYLEVQSQLDVAEVEPWPINATSLD